MTQNKKIALVTGAGSGIGRAVALALLEDGFSLVLAGRRAEPLQAVVAQALAAGGEALAVPTDVRDEQSVAQLFATIEEVHGRLDVIFNNAGINAPAVPVDELPLENWRNVIATNVDGVFLCARAAFGLMRRQQPQGGRIINNGSISAHTPRPFTAPYTASKHAVLGLTKALAREVMRPETEALFISCSNFRTLDIIPALEAETGVPVITSNQAALWGTLRSLRDRRVVPGAGRLFQIS